MPYKLPLPCRAPGCAALIPGGGYCPEHIHLSPAREYEARRARGNATLRLRRGSNWTRLAAMVRARNPLCCDPLGWHDFYPAPSEQVHHIQNAEDHPHLIFDPSNLAAVCRSCHAEVERMHKAGQPTAHLFEGKAAGGFTSGVA